ncbi:MAG: peptide deformylase [Chloroflexota bacterium]
MAILPIRTVPDPILRRKAKPVSTVDDSVRKLARDMIETLHHARGVGLAAPQIGRLQRLIVIQMEGEDPRVLINPDITRREGEREVEEGCLSVPGYLGRILRSEKIKARAVDEWGAKVRLTADQLLAQAVEHEVDHLNGILYLDHLRSHEDLYEAGQTSEAEHEHEYQVEVEDQGMLKSRGESRVLTVRNAEGGVAEVTGEEIVEASDRDGV